MHDEPFFLTYANNSLEGHPERIRVILKAAQKTMPVSNFTEDLYDGYHLWGELYIAAARDNKEALAEISEFLFPVDTPKRLQFVLDRWGNFSKSSICLTQKAHTNIMDAISTGMNYNKIDFFSQLLRDSENIKMTFECGQSSIIQKKVWRFIGRVIPNDLSMEHLLPDLFSYSLRNFLVDDRNFQRLKKCRYCQKYFIAKNKKRKICYTSSCVTSYHREDMQKRRDDNPVKYC